jgi:hypothetical protein
VLIVAETSVVIIGVTGAVGGIVASRQTRRGTAGDREDDVSATTQLSLLRKILGFQIASLFLLVFALAFIAPWNGGGDPGWSPAIVALWGAGALLGVRWMRRRPRDISSPRRLAGSYVGAIWIGVGFAMSSAFGGFAAVFMPDKLWIGIEGLVFALIGMVQLFPARRNIERRQVGVLALGSSLSLREALTASPDRPTATDSSG